MERKALGRDLGLSVRMALALALVGSVYLAAVLFSAFVLWFGIVDGNVGGVFAWLFLTACFAVAAVAHVRRSERVAFRTVRARLLERDQEPELQALVARVAAAADVPRPQVALARSWAPNAFAVGLTPGRAIVVVTTELLRRLDERELEAVVAHEVAHIANRDGAVMTFVSGPVMLGSALWHADDDRAKLFFALYLPVYLFGFLVMWTMSRYREYTADRGAALITGAPEQLMSALQVIARVRPRGDLRGGRAVSALCIVPAKRKERRLEILMDHPRLSKRLDALAELARELGRPVS